MYAAPKVKHLLEELGNAGENTLAERAPLLDENMSVIEQNKANDRRRGRNLELGLGKFMRWEALEAERSKKEELAARKACPRKTSGRRV